MNETLAYWQAERTGVDVSVAAWIHQYQYIHACKLRLQLPAHEKFLMQHRATFQPQKSASTARAGRKMLWGECEACRGFRREYAAT